jgi:hypothetical protein
MKPIHFENLIQNNNYLISYNEKKYMGIFNKLFNYDYFSIAVFNDIFEINSLEETKITKNFIIGSYYNKIEFYIPESEKLLLEQILRQKIKDEILSKIVSKILF